MVLQKKSRFSLGFYFPLILILILPKITHSDGCFFRPSETIGNSAESPNQRAIIIHNENVETLILQVKYSGDVKNFAWVIPLPALPKNDFVETVDDSIFRLLHDYTQPKLYRETNSVLGAKGGRGYSNDELDEFIETEVKVWNRLNVGPYEVAILSGTSSQLLTEWLSTNQFHIPDDAEEIIDFYIQKKWYFVAFRVDVQTQNDQKNSTYQAGLPCVKITFPTENPLFPLRISELSSAQNNEIELYVVAKHRMISNNYWTIQLDQNEVEKKLNDQVRTQIDQTTGISYFCKDVVAPSETNIKFDYEKIFWEEVKSFSQPTLFVEYANDLYWYNEPMKGSFEGYFNEYFPPDSLERSKFWITRIRTILHPNQMKDDVIFIQDPDGDRSFRLGFIIETNSPNPWQVSKIGFMGILFIPLVFIRNKQKQTKILLFLILFLMALI